MVNKIQYIAFFVSTLVTIVPVCGITQTQAPTTQITPSIEPIPNFIPGHCGEPNSIYKQCGRNEGFLPGLNRTIEDFIKAIKNGKIKINCPKNYSYHKILDGMNDITLGVERTFFPYICCCILPEAITLSDPNNSNTY